ncbi:SUN domain-containing ossification factor [Galendromus occidentalis]|uniref:SUN domain-containing ossification factor n=1 Tax=Galendromus occidentalis TaxID=34638 RepID=A0AAJ7L344_9ACAR|nr:SUN domain-containing ossification factor [Galendromus occidentalis]
MERSHKQNETDNTTASILNDSIIQDKEAMPSFDEWKKIRLEKEKQDPSYPSPKEPEHRDGGIKANERKRGRRNYASIECGAKIVAANANAAGASKVLLEATDEYMLNPCNSLMKSGMWFIVELCESIHPTHIELANFELYSSTGKEFVVYMSDHYQSREWTEVGRFEMAHLKTVQSFPLDAPGFGKVIKVEFLSIYENNQYYCPLSLVRVFGSSMVDDYEEKVSEDSQGTPEPIEKEQIVEPTPASVTIVVDENMVSRAKKAMFNIINSVSKVVSGTKTLDGNCSDCSTNESSDHVLSLGQQFDNCFELTNLSGPEGHLWPSMKCRFAQVANVQRSCRPLLVAPSINIEPSPLKPVSNLSPPVSMPASTAAVPSITMTAEMISPTTVAEAEKNEELKTQSKVLQMKLVTATENDTPSQAHPSVTRSSQPEAEPVPVAKPNVKLPPLSHMNPVPSNQPTPAPNQATKENLFSRFENRIKKLELHMNLSGTYLEELSRRYRNQMEEMQAAFNKTVAALNMEAKKGLERDHNQQQALAVLQEKLSAVTESLRKLEIESDSLWWRLLLAYLGLLASSIAMITVLSRQICLRTIRNSAEPVPAERQILEILERLYKEKYLQENADSSKQNGSEKPKEETPQIAEKLEMTEEETVNIKTEPKLDDLKPMEIKIEPLDEHCSEVRQNFAEPSNGVSQKAHQDEEEAWDAGDLKKEFPVLSRTSVDNDVSLPTCTKCALSCCSHALFRH